MSKANQICSFIWILCQEVFRKDMKLYMTALEGQHKDIQLSFNLQAVSQMEECQLGRETIIFTIVLTSGLMLPSTFGMT